MVFLEIFMFTKNIFNFCILHRNVLIYLYMKYFKHNSIIKVNMQKSSDNLVSIKLFNF